MPLMHPTPWVLEDAADLCAMLANEEAPVIERPLEQAAQDLYASPVRAFRKVTLPLSMPGLVAGTLLFFIPASGDYINAELLGTPNEYMIGNVIDSAFLVRLDYPQGAALSFLLMAAILAIVFVYLRKAGTEEVL